MRMGEEGLGMRMGEEGLGMRLRSEEVWEWRMCGNEAVTVLSLGERAQFVFDTKSISTWYFTTIIDAYMNTTEESCFSHDLYILRTLYGHVASQWIHSTCCFVISPFS